MHDAIAHYEKLLATYSQGVSVPPFKVIDLDNGELEQAAEKAQQGHIKQTHTHTHTHTHTEERERESREQSREINEACVLSYLLNNPTAKSIIWLETPKNPTSTLQDIEYYRYICSIQRSYLRGDNVVCFNDARLP